MIRPSADADFELIQAITNDAAEACRSVIPDDRRHEPRMGRYRQLIAPFDLIQASLR